MGPRDRWMSGLERELELDLGRDASPDADATEDDPHAHRVDMHVHTSASAKPVIAAFKTLGCPESYSPPEKVYDLAKSRGMTMVTITDHDTISGAMALVERGFEDLFVGQEVTVYFPEDRCKLHVLVWGLTPELDEEIAKFELRDDVYVFADWLRERNLAHALAHPLYVQNDRLTLWHLERCALLFKGFERLNGAHSSAHVKTLDKWLDALTPAKIERLKLAHGLGTRWSRIWNKAATAGSDDHALLNVGRTYTEVAHDPANPITTPEEFLDAVMMGRGRPCGEAGHVSLLAHQLMTVGLNWYADRVHPTLRPRGRAVGAAVAKFSGVEAEGPSRAALCLDTLLAKLTPGRWRAGKGSSFLRALSSELGPLLAEYRDIRACVENPGTPDGPAMAQHERMAAFADDLVDRLSDAMRGDGMKALRNLDQQGMIDSLVSSAALVAFQLPYLFSLSHQNKERRFLQQIERESGIADGGAVTPDSMRLMLFTDTLGDVNGVSRFIQNVGEQGHLAGRNFRIVTSTRLPVPEVPYITNHKPVFAMSMPGYANLDVALPPLLRLWREVDAFQPDVVHISTPGPVGLAGWLAAKRLGVPVCGVYHTDFPAYIDHLFDDAVYTKVCSDYMKFFYSPFDRIFSRSDDYMASLEGLGLDRRAMVRLSPGIALETFQPSYKDDSVWSRFEGVSPRSLKVLSIGRVSVEKNLPLLTEIWPAIRRRCADEGREVELIVVGDGPYRKQMQAELSRHGAHFLGFRHGEELSTIYASSDLFVFPSLTDTLGQVVLESQSSGVPVIVSDQGGPKEVVDHGITGLILPGSNPGQWQRTIVELLLDDEKRERMGRTAHTRASRYSIRASFDHFWRVHYDAWEDAFERESGASAPAHARRGVDRASAPIRPKA